MKVKKYHLLLPLFLSLALYHQTLAYPFIYDDVWRIVKNDAVKTLAQPMRFFLDPATQAGTSLLHHDNYRPLSVILTALQYSLAGETASAFRSVNLLLHGVNASLVLLLGVELLGLSLGAAAVASLLFLVHPAQTESVIWISSQSNLLATTFLLAGLLTWFNYRNKNLRRDRTLAWGIFAAGLLVREAMIVFPLACAWMDRTIARKENRKSAQALEYGVFGALAAIYLMARHTLLGQTGQSDWSGGNIWANFANVFQIFPLYLKTIFWPDSLRVTYADLPVVNNLLNWKSIAGLLLIGGISADAIFLRARPRWRPLSFCLGLFLILWLPGSNLVPLRTLFAERLLYPMIAAAAWALSFGLDTIWKKEIHSWARTSALLLPVLLTLMTLKTVYQSRVWSQELNLWAHAAAVAPDNWFAPMNLSALYLRGGALDKAEEACMASLNNHPPEQAGGDLFFRLAMINRMRGDRKKAEEYARRAFVLRPDLEKVWSPQ